MPMMRVKEIRDMHSEERARRLQDLKAELVRLRTMIRAGGTIENPARIKQLRKAIARLLTVESEEKLGMSRTKKKRKPKQIKAKNEEKAKKQKEQKKR